MITDKEFIERAENIILVAPPMSVRPIMALLPCHAKQNKNQIRIFIGHASSA